MVLLDFILDLAGLLLWVAWSSLRIDHFRNARPAMPGGTVRRSETPATAGWYFLAGLLVLLLLRAYIYQQIGTAADWTPRLDLFFIALPFRGYLFVHQLLFSLLSFLQMLIVFYFWIVALVVINQTSTPDPIQKMLANHIGAVGRWPRWLLTVLPLLVTGALWAAVSLILIRLEIVQPPASGWRLLQQCLLIGTAVYVSLKFLLAGFLLLYVINSYVYLGKHPLLDFVDLTARNLLKPLRSLPFQFRRFDFTPLVATGLVLLLFHSVPEMIRRGLLWPQ